MKLNNNVIEILFFSRLEDYERNQNFKGEPVSCVDLNDVPVIWPISGFKQLTLGHRNSLPTITKDQVKGYFILRMGLDGRSVGDCQEESRTDASVQTAASLQSFSGGWADFLLWPVFGINEKKSGSTKRSIP